MTAPETSATDTATIEASDTQLSTPEASQPDSAANPALIAGEVATQGLHCQNVDGTTLTGKGLRHQLPRSAFAELHLPKDRDPQRILAEQNETRLQDLVPVRMGRMLQSPFTYYRGTAAVMAADLADAPVTGPRVVACGDAHISNFGFFASPERALLFDLNDFDEAGIAPWEWDVQRMAASVYIGGRDNGFSEDDCREATIRSVEGYRSRLHELMQLTPTERFFIQVDAESLERRVSGSSRKLAQKFVSKARGRTSDQVLGKMATRESDGVVRIVDQPPVTRHTNHASAAEIEQLVAAYRSSIREDSAYLLMQFKPVDAVLRVVGVGSVGTRCYVIALEGADGDVMFLQAKEAQQSVLVQYGKMPLLIPGRPAGGDLSEGHRVVAGQRILQAQSDPFLGHIIGYAGEDSDRGRRVDYYWRQFRDMKGSVEPSQLNTTQFATYGSVCGELLARAHSQSCQPAQIAADYLGKNSSFAEAIATWSRAYADVAEADFHALEKAAGAGRFPVERGV